MFFLELHYHESGIKILLHLWLWVFLLEAALVYECVFWRWWHKICNILLMSNFESPSQGGIHFEGEILSLYFVCDSYIQGCRKLIVEKVCDNVSFSFKLFIEALPLIVIIDALKFCIESLIFVFLFCVGVLHWILDFWSSYSMLVFYIEVFMVSRCPSHVLKLSWILVILLGELKLCVKVSKSLVSL